MRDGLPAEPLPAIRSDNGPEFVAKAVREWISSRSFATLYIEPGSPWQNAYSEMFNSRLRDELLNVESFGSVLEAKVLAKEYRRVYNEKRPHSSLGYRTPAEFARHCLVAHSATLHRPQDNANSPNETQTANQAMSTSALS